MKRILVLVIAIISITLLYYIDNQISDFRINRVEIETNKLDSQIRISQITDFHSNHRVDLTDIIESIEGFDPHIIVLTGDIIDFKTVDFSLSYELVEMLVSIDKPIYFVNGNHEHGNDGFRSFLSGIEDRGVTLLSEKRDSVEVEGSHIALFGADFYSQAADYETLFKGIDSSSYNVLLSHSPNKPIPFLSEDIDLILSGHTHGGQVRLPIVGGVLSPGEGFFPEYDKGIMEIGDTILYIDSGLGNSVLPIRLFNPVQISEIVIK